MDQLTPLSKRRPEEQTEAQREQEYHMPEWAKGVVWYQIFPERFNNGDHSNNPTGKCINAPEGWRLSPWTGDWYERADWEYKLGDKFTDGIYKRRYGGDLQGIIDKLDYLQDLGVEALYLNPVFDAISLHKYDTSYYHHIDCFFGPDPEGDQAVIASEDPSDPDTWKWTSADKLFLELVQKVHQRGMKIIIDGVFNHTGTDFWAFRDLIENQQQSEYRDWYVVNSFDDDKNGTSFNYEGWWGFETLPEFNQVDGNLYEPVKHHIFEITKRWMLPEGDRDRGVDGWRLDVPEEIGKAFWREWNGWVRNIDPDAYTVGEIWSDDASEWVGKDLFSATMNYQFAESVQNFMINESVLLTDFLKELDRQRSQLPQSAPLGMQNLMDSHDTPRLASMVVNAGLPYNKKGKPEYGFNVRKPRTQERRLQRLIALFQFTYTGAPMIYYGTEAGMWGAGDPDDRKPMVWPELDFEPERTDPLGRERLQDGNNFEPSLFRWYKQLAGLRRKYASLRKGDMKIIQSNNERQSFVFTRKFADEPSLIVVINRSNKTQMLGISADHLFREVSARLKNVLTGNVINIIENKANIYLPPVTGAVLIQE